MSEYQYYEFQAVDRCLTDKEMSKLRSFSTRANITQNSFVIDLRDLAARGNHSEFLVKFNALKQRHSTKSSFIGRLRKIETHV